MAPFGGEGSLHVAAIIEARFISPEPALEAACLMGNEDAMRGVGEKGGHRDGANVGAGQRTNSWNKRGRRLTRVP